ncbi:hypothetical protein Taro_015867 [Colocasia esculenta]|uniref:Uncharacterized protein n=1 Tax=Colocasia esculenta TaxID=4460 RepID=A0A843UR66_COLES|nr:hypothetical protein [Colocasia esculenta]
MDACMSLGVSERLLREAEDRYCRGRERAVREGRASTYSASYLVMSSEYQRNVQEGHVAQRSTDSHASMRPPAPHSIADPGEAESSRHLPLAESGGKVQMWTLMVVVALGGRGVDTNLRILQVIGSPESRFSTWFSFSLAPASCPRVPKASNRYRRVVGGSWDVWRCRITRGNAVAWCNSRESSRGVRCEPGEFGRFKRVLR